MELTVVESRLVTLDDVRRAAAKHLERTGVYPTLVGLRPSDFDDAQTRPVIGGVKVLTFMGVRVIPCPDTEPGTVEVLRP